MADCADVVVTRIPVGRDSDKRELRAKAALGRLQGAGSSSSEGGVSEAMPVETMHDFIDLLADCESEEE